jgi:Tfp pilus assembly protein FimT
MFEAAYRAERQIRDRLKKIAMKKNDKKSRQRFTLIELLAAIVFLTIIASIAIPSYSGYSSNTKLRAAAKYIQADILEVQERAIAESTMYRITFDPRGNRYTIERGTETGEPYTPIEVKSLGSFGEDVSIFSVVFGGGIPIITFGAKGIATTGKVVLNNSRGTTATIAAAVSGRTYVQVIKQ